MLKCTRNIKINCWKSNASKVDKTGFFQWMSTISLQKISLNAPSQIQFTKFQISNSKIEIFITDKIKKCCECSAVKDRHNLFVLVNNFTSNRRRISLDVPSSFFDFLKSNIEKEENTAQYLRSTFANNSQFWKWQRVHCHLIQSIHRLN